MSKKVEENRGSGRLEALEAARTQIEKQFGKGSLMTLGDSMESMDVETFPSGSIAWCRRIPEGTHHRDLRPGIVR